MPKLNPRDPKGDVRTNGNGSTRSKYESRAGRTVESDLLPLADADTPLVAAITAVLQASDAIMFGRTSDGGVLVITVFSQGGNEKTYHKTQKDFMERLAEIENIARDSIV